MNREELLRKLLTTFHLNVPERKLLDASIRRRDLEAEVEHILQEQGTFLCPICVVNKLNTNQYELCREVEVSFARYQKIRTEYATLEQAAGVVVRLIIDDYPSGTIDGLIIEE